MLFRSHARALRDIPGVELVAACCRTEEKGRAFAGQFGCEWFADAAQMIRRAKPDFVTVATPSGAHLEAVLAAARRGVHVICEKPLEISLGELMSKYEFTGRTKVDIPEAIEIKKELEQIDELLKQIEEAAKTAQVGLIDMEALSQFAQPGDLNALEEIREQIRNVVRELAERQGLDRSESGAFRLTPKAYKTFQAKLLERIFADLEASRSGRHTGRIVGDGSVELPTTKAYEFGDSIANMDIVQTVTNAMLRRPDERPVRLRSDDIEVFKTRNSPKCATVVVMDMSGSMRYDGQYKIGRAHV